MTLPLDGFNLKGFINCLESIPGTNNEVEIIDYKTGKNEPRHDERSKQLLLYACGLEYIHPQYKVKRLTLELLALPSPRIFELKNWKYEAIGNSRMEALDENAINNIIETAKQIAYDYEHGFRKTTDGNTCRDCGYRLYC